MHQSEPKGSSLKAKVRGSFPFREVAPASLLGLGILACAPLLQAAGWGDNHFWGHDNAGDGRGYNGTVYVPYDSVSNYTGGVGAAFWYLGGLIDIYNSGGAALNAYDDARVYACWSCYGYTYAGPGWATMVFSSDLLSGQSQWFKGTTTAHETGHALGLGHCDINPGSIMHPSDITYYIGWHTWDNDITYQYNNSWF